MRPHKDLIIAWAHGAIIEYEAAPNKWLEVDCPNWSSGYKFRIKPSKVARFKEILLHETMASTYTCDGDLLIIKVYHHDLEQILNKLCNPHTETQP